MKAYRVDEIEGHSVLSSQTVEALAPYEAARKVLGVEVTLRSGAQKWVRVVELTDRPPTRLRPGVFEFKAVGCR